MNNVNSQRIRDCSGCFACSAICKVGAINIEQDKNGFYKPIVNNELCVECGACKKVCYSHIDIPSADGDLKAYYGWHKDADILKNSASGGITTAVSQVALENGYLVIGCAYDHNDKKAKHIIVRKKEDIKKILGSKYFQSDLSGVYEAVKALPKDIKLVFFGTPCQVLGFKEFLALERFNLENIIFVELFCHGIASPLVWKSYINESRIKDIKDVRFRTKSYGWHVPSNEFVTDKKGIVSKKSGDNFFTAYYSTEFFNNSCYNCEIKKNLSNADLRIGDFWGTRFAENKKGVSCVVTSSLKGEQLLEKCKNYFYLFGADLAEILSAQSYNKNHSLNEDKWNENFQLLGSYGLGHSLKNINKRKPLIHRLKRLVYVLISNIRSNFRKIK